MTPQMQFKEAVSLHQQGRLVEAEKLYRQIMAAAPDNFAVRYMFALMRFHQKRNAEALELIEEAVRRNSASADALALYGVLLHGAGRREEALSSLDAAIAIKPDDASCWYNRGLALRSLSRFADALDSQTRAIALNPNHADAWKNRGLILAELGRRDEAMAAMEKALALNPDDAEAWHQRGMALYSLKRHREARESFDKALEINPDHIQALYRRGVTAWMGAMDYDAAARDLEQALRLDPECPYALGWLLMIRQYGGDWRDFAVTAARIDEGVRAGKKVAEPFLYQAISQSPADIQACSVIYAADRYPARAPLAPRGPRRSGKLRIGYVSGEFRDQATAYLTAGLYECHDREKFEIIAFDNGWDDGSAVRRRLDAGIGKFVDISRLDDRQAAQAVLAEEIDILVNLNGYFGDHRMDVFAHRPAPIQVNYLGFPATLGADYIDYLIADRIVIPERERQFFTEQIVYLPDSYQVNDSRRGKPDAMPSRAACGLPEEGFVFCNFNASYKLTPQAFAGWMRILRQVPESVLWLLEFHPRFSENIRRQAEAEDIPGSRIVFAPVVKQEIHMARLALADLFLDALPYNAHTTASDALWAGVPLVTCKGSAFAGRVAASLLAAIGLPELVRETQNDYEVLAVRLAREKATLEALRRKLAQNRTNAALFDTARFTHNLEAAYAAMGDNWRRGEPPRGFSV
jgi:predicted O-linked N-acetylglucosamine transferase (SPINDLY family)